MATMSEELSADEIALYDRQLRLWGIEAQNRMRKAHVLLITIRALGNEIAKNLVLAGIGSLTIMDSNLVTESDVASQFFISGEDIGKNVPSVLKLTYFEAC
jgi:ubiquitin-like 1-activating enzyme E1 A